MKRINVFLCSLSFTAFSCTQEKPNVLFIAIDDLNDWVGVMNGHPQAKTLNIDALARSGVLFTNAHCQAPLSGPSRASIMTGLRPSSTGIYGMISDNKIKSDNEFTKDIQFLPEYFKNLFSEPVYNKVIESHRQLLPTTNLKWNTNSQYTFQAYFVEQKERTSKE